MVMHVANCLAFNVAFELCTLYPNLCSPHPQCWQQNAGEGTV